MWKSKKVKEEENKLRFRAEGKYLVDKLIDRHSYMSIFPRNNRLVCCPSWTRGTTFLIHDHNEIDAKLSSAQLMVESYRTRYI